MAMSEGGVNKEASTRIMRYAGRDEQITRKPRRAVSEVIGLKPQFT
jgi:hypothetical protein